MAVTEWTPIVELEKGQDVSDAFDATFGNIDDKFVSVDEAAAKTAGENVLHGVKNPNTPILSINVDTTKYEVVALTYYIQGVEYSYTGATIASGFGQAGDFIDIGLDASGIVTKINGFFTPDELKTILEIGRIATTDGVNVTAIGDSVYFVDEFMENLYIRFKSFEGAKFFNGSGRSSENVGTPFALDIEGGTVSTANVQKQTITAETTISGFPVYNVSGTIAIRPEQTPLLAQNTQYDDGTNLAPIPTDNYVVHTLFKSLGTGNYYLEYGKTLFTNLNDAFNSYPVNTLFDLQGSEVEELSKIIVKEGQANITQIVDIREGRNEPIMQVPQEEFSEFFGVSLAGQQEPTLIDTPIQVEFGQALVGTNATLSVTGDITILTTAEYHITTVFHFGRTGGAGTSELFIRKLVNGVQVGSSLHAVLSSADFIFPVTAFEKIFFNAGDVITFELYRDSSGNNSGGLFSHTPSLLDWELAPTASVRVIKHN